MTPMHDPEAVQRARNRQSWPVVLRELGKEDPPSPGGPAACLACMWELALQSWRLAGVTLPDYERAATPIRLIRRHEAT